MTRASPVSGRFSNRPYVASPSRSEGDGGCRRDGVNRGALLILGSRVRGNDGSFAMVSRGAKWRDRGGSANPYSPLGYLALAFCEGAIRAA